MSQQWTTERWSDLGHLRLTVLEDEYSKILFLEIDTYSIGQHAWERLELGKRYDGMGTGWEAWLVDNGDSDNDLDSEGNDFWENFWSGWRHIFQKEKWECPHLLHLHPHPSEINVKGEKDFVSFEKGHDRAKFELVIKRVANEDWLALLSRWREVKIQTQDKWKKPAPRAKWKDVSHNNGRTGDAGRRQKEHLG